MKATLTNNDDGYPLEYLLQMWDSENSIWIDYYIMLFTYDANNNAIETLMQVWYNDWMNFMYITMTWDASNFLTEMIRQQWDPGAGIWINEERNTYTYDGSNLMELLDEEWEGGGWINYHLSLYTYDGAGHALERLKDEWIGGAWVNYQWNQYSYDGSWNEIEDWVQMWQGGNWENHEIYYQIWEEGNMIEKLMRIWNGSKEWINEYKETYTYGDFAIDEDNVFQSEKNLISYPNPFTSQTEISFNILQKAVVSLNIYTIKGEKVKTLINNSILNRDTHKYTWNGKNESEDSVENGIYFYKLQIDNYTSVKKLLLMK